MQEHLRFPEDYNGSTLLESAKSFNKLSWHPLPSSSNLKILYWPLCLGSPVPADSIDMVERRFMHQTLSCKSVASFGQYLMIICPVYMHIDTDQNVSIRIEQLLSWLNCSLATPKTHSCTEIPKFQPTSNMHYDSQSYMRKKNSRITGLWPKFGRSKIKPLITEPGPEMKTK